MNRDVLLSTIKHQLRSIQNSDSLDLCEQVHWYVTNTQSNERLAEIVSILNKLVGTPTVEDVSVLGSHNYLSCEPTLDETGKRLIYGYNKILINNGGRYFQFTDTISGDAVGGHSICCLEDLLKMLSELKGNMSYEEYCKAQQFVYVMCCLTTMYKYAKDKTERCIKHDADTVDAFLRNTADQEYKDGLCLQSCLSYLTTQTTEDLTSVDMSSGVVINLCDKSKDGMCYATVCTRKDSISVTTKKLGAEYVTCTIRVPEYILVAMDGNTYVCEYVYEMLLEFILSVSGIRTNPEPLSSMCTVDTMVVDAHNSVTDYDQLLILLAKTMSSWK